MLTVIINKVEYIFVTAKLRNSSNLCKITRYKLEAAFVFTEKNPVSQRDQDFRARIYH